MAALRGLLDAEQPRCQACILNAQGGYGNAELPPWRGRLVQHWPAQRLQVRLLVLRLGDDGQVCDAPRTLPVPRAFTLGSRNAPAILMHQVYDALRDLTDECGSGCLGDVLVYPFTTAARRMYLWMVLDWLLEYQLHVCARVSEFWSMCCHAECVLDLDCGSLFVAACCSRLPADHPQLHVQTEMASHTQSRGRDAAVGGSRCC